MNGPQLTSGFTLASGPRQGQVQGKHAQAIQACNLCRARKQKCDEARPCQFCSEHNFDCQYNSSSPPRRNRSVMQLQDSINNMSARQDVKNRLPPSQGFRNTPKFASLKAAFASPTRDPSASRMPISTHGKMHPRRVGGTNIESPMFPYSNTSTADAQTPPPIKHKVILSMSQQPATPTNCVKTDKIRTSNNLLSKERSGLQSNHATPAHKLLEEESGRALSDYPMRLEQDRELLRVYNDSDAPSPMPEKGGFLHPSKNYSAPQNYSSYKYGLSGLGPDSRPNFRTSVVNKLHKAYIKHMHSLHPFLDRSKLQTMIKEFKELYSPDRRVANSVSPVAHQLNPSLKRKRSTGFFSEPYSFQGAIERLLPNAIVLLVLALGKVCSYRKSLPHPQNKKSPCTNRAWEFFSSRTNSNFNSDTSDDTCLSNINILPRMAYFSYATSILGYQQEGHTLEHAQAMILAAIYTSHACRVTIVLLKQDYHKLTCDFYTSPESKNLSLKERYRLELVLLSSDCSLRTNCAIRDIVAEMSTLPTSDVIVHQNRIMYPTGVCGYFPVEENELTEGTQVNRKSEHDKDLIIYSTHNALYKASSFDQGSIIAKDSNPPSTDPNLACLRAKYYGGAYIMLRPCLQIASYIMEYTPPVQAPYQNGHWPHSNSPSATGETLTPTSRPVSQVDLSETQKDVVSIASQCIESAIKSTVAFNRVGAPKKSLYVGFKSTRNTRLVLTNVFRTLHAQFGNMLILAAVFKSRLYYLLPSNTSLTLRNLHALFERTFEVLSKVVHNSPILKVDLDILRNVRNQLNNQRGLPPFQL
ncbi:C6 zinc finger domain-containing protein [Alternaria rosae]|uniref:C6 zinc finger domain-containing protein n=1 Tax=Alternaria rosae TaxID=1187941 RepID=UPI001E8E6059|nr:C6 zinc finger domain-containing protein [Alternaria rosae]KAH6867158.1 C6 zinc finger domain-containing protein [Alternaria rosae]